MAKAPPIPIAADTYDQTNEQSTRIIIEQELQDIRNELIRIERSLTKSSTLANRRHQFLLMGASD